MIRDFTAQEAEQHNGLTAEAWSLIGGELLLNEPTPVRKSNWFVRRKLKQAISLFEQALEINPEGWQSMWAIGKIYQRLGHPDEAFRWFSRAYEINPKQPDVAREAGLAALDLGRAQEALRLCQAAVELDPEDAGLMANLAWAHLISGDVTHAVATIEVAAARNPGDEISQTVLRIMNEVAAGLRPIPKSLLEISRFH